MPKPKLKTLPTVPDTAIEVQNNSFFGGVLSFFKKAATEAE